MINSVQVTHAVYGGGLDDFEEVPTTMEGGVEEALDDFGIVTSSTASPAQEMADALKDDEIPFN
jgi:hypothetical protein